MLIGSDEIDGGSGGGRRRLAHLVHLRLCHPGLVEDRTRARCLLHEHILNIMNKKILYILYILYKYLNRRKRARRKSGELPAAPG